MVHIFWSSDAQDRSVIAPILKEVNQLSRVYSSFQFRLVHRPANVAAHPCAKNDSPERQRCAWINMNYGFVFSLQLDYNSTYSVRKSSRFPKKSARAWNKDLAKKHLNTVKFWKKRNKSMQKEQHISVYKKYTNHIFHIQERKPRYKQEKENIGSINVRFCKLMRQH